MQFKTAKDMPTGAVIYYRSVEWTRTSHSTEDLQWTASTGEWASNNDIDQMLSDGACITHIPTHRRSPARTD